MEDPELVARQTMEPARRCRRDEEEDGRRDGARPARRRDGLVRTVGLPEPPALGMAFEPESGDDLSGGRSHALSISVCGLRASLLARPRR